VFFYTISRSRRAKFSMPIRIAGLCFTPDVNKTSLQSRLSQFGCFCPSVTSMKTCRSRAFFAVLWLENQSDEVFAAYRRPATDRPRAKFTTNLNPEKHDTS